MCPSKGEARLSSWQRGPNTLPVDHGEAAAITKDHNKRLPVSLSLCLFCLFCLFALFSFSFVRLFCSTCFHLALIAMATSVQIETCQICFDDFEVITLAGPGLDDEEEGLDDFSSPFSEPFPEPFPEPFFVPNDFSSDDDLEPLLLALQLSMLDAPDDTSSTSTSSSTSSTSTAASTSTSASTAPATSPPKPSSSWFSYLVNSSSPPRTQTNPFLRTELRNSTAARTQSPFTSSATPTRSATSRSLGPPPPYDSSEPLTLGFSLPCDKGHLFCSNCLKRYIEMKLQSSVWPIVCPNEKCKGDIPATIVEGLLGIKSTKWYELSVERAVTNKVSMQSNLHCWSTPMSPFGCAKWG